MKLRAADLLQDIPLEFKVEEAWKSAMYAWNNPSVPNPIVPLKEAEIKELECADVLKDQIAFMDMHDFQVYVNGDKVARIAIDNQQLGMKAAMKHEICHRFVPYDVIEFIIQINDVKQALKGMKLPYSPDIAAPLIANQFQDMCGNTFLVRQGDQDLPWLYAQISKDPNISKSKLWKVYGKSMEIAWKQKMLPQDAKFSDEEEQAARNIAKLFKEGSFLDPRYWDSTLPAYARLIAPFLEDKKGDQQGRMDKMEKNVPKKLSKELKEAIARRVAERNGSKGLQKFKQIMAGYEKGNPTEACLSFYEALARQYDVSFSGKATGRNRQHPFQPVKWFPSRRLEELDIDYSLNSSGTLIPGVTTYSWNTRHRPHPQGIEEVVMNLDLFMDSSGSMPNPVGFLSFPVLAGCVVVKKALRKGAYVRTTVFSGDKQHNSSGWTREEQKAMQVLMTYYNGGTIFPVEMLDEKHNPRQVLVVTDTGLANMQETAAAIKRFKSYHPKNKVTIYATTSEADLALRDAGAEVIVGQTADIFNHVIGKGQEIYE